MPNYVHRQVQWSLASKHLLRLIRDAFVKIFSRGQEGNLLGRYWGTL